MQLSRIGDSSVCAGFLRFKADAVSRCAIFVGQISALLLFLLSPHAAAQMQASEPELKAAILVNMLLFVDWPSQPQQAADRFLLCYLGDSPMATALGQLEGKLIKGKPLHVMRADADHAGGCHVFYFSSNDEAALTKSAPSLRTSRVFLAGDSPGYLQRGAMLNLELVGGRVAFDIDLRGARQSGLTVSSKVLRLARQVLE
jgi:hypothetical protein